MKPTVTVCMPYIKKKNREKYDKILEEVACIFSRHDLNERNIAGELNYLITSIIKTAVPFPQSYRVLNELIGVLECAKLELYRRTVAPYEDQKIQENGDV